MSRALPRTSAYSLQEKNKPQIISLCARDSIYWSFSRIPYGASQSLGPIHAESRGKKADREGKRGERDATFNKTAAYMGEGRSEGGGTRSDLRLQKYWAWICKKMHCKYGPMQSLSGFSTTVGGTFRKDVKFWPGQTIKHF